MATSYWRVVHRSWAVIGRFAPFVPLGEAVADYRHESVGLGVGLLPDLGGAAVADEPSALVQIEADLGAHGNAAAHDIGPRLRQRRAGVRVERVLPGGSSG